MSANGLGRGCDDLREIVMDVVRDAGDPGVRSFDNLLDKIPFELEKRAGLPAVNPVSLRPAARLPPGVSDQAVEIVWDLVRRGDATFCPDAPKSGWPGLRRSRRDSRFMEALSHAVDVSPEALVYLEAAAAAFSMDCLISASNMLALAAEVEFLRLLAAAKSSQGYGGHFSRIGDGLTLAEKIAQFRDAMKDIRAGLPRAATDEMDADLEAVQFLIWAARSESSKPGCGRPSRDQVYLNLQLFIAFARQAKRLRQELSDRPAARLARLR